MLNVDSRVLMGRRWFAPEQLPSFSWRLYQIVVRSCTDIDDAERLQNDFAILPESLNAMWKVNLTGDVQFSNTKFQEYMGGSLWQGECFLWGLRAPDEYAASLASTEDGIKSKAPFNVERRLKVLMDSLIGSWLAVLPSWLWRDRCRGQVELAPTCRWRKPRQNYWRLYLPLLSGRSLPRDVNANKTFRNYVGAKEGMQLMSLVTRYVLSLITHL
jgi:hypothetical protein